MKRVMVSAAIIASMFTAAAPVAAQGWESGAFWRGAPSGAWERIGFLQQRIDRGVRDGSLDRHESWRVQRELRNIREEAGRMRRHDGGRLSGTDEARLQSRLDDLSRRIRWLRHNGW
ncbi:MAG TPA: hypothetical protein VH331_07840 [Allosphingosinicella sp.]|jgi:hypothetical protein|nr:hypothetical protein [Allosphingosinicella sp.]